MHVHMTSYTRAHLTYTSSSTTPGLCWSSSSLARAGIASSIARSAPAPALECTLLHPAANVTRWNCGSRPSAQVSPWVFFAFHSDLEWKSFQRLLDSTRCGPPTSLSPFAHSWCCSHVSWMAVLRHGPFACKGSSASPISRSVSLSGPCSGVFSSERPSHLNSFLFHL